MLVSLNFNIQIMPRNLYFKNTDYKKLLKHGKTTRKVLKMSISTHFTCLLTENNTALRRVLDQLFLPRNAYKIPTLNTEFSLYLS